MSNDERAAFEAAMGSALIAEQGEFALSRAYEEGRPYTFLATKWAWAAWQAAYQRAQPSDDVAKDAARYQWLVKHSTYGIDYRQRPELTLSIYAPDHRDGLSAAIDAAMGQWGSDEQPAQNAYSWR